MNGFAERGLDERRFHGEANPGGLKVFDAFPKTKPTYLTRTAAGGQFTLFLLLVCLAFTFSEFRHWRHGHTDHGFRVEAGVGHALQLNADLVLPMACVDLHVNVRDASGDLIMAGEVLKKDDTSWRPWAEDRQEGKKRVPVHDDEADEDYEGYDYDDFEEEEETAQEVLHDAYRGSRRFSPTPRRRRNKSGGACRIYGSMSLNRVQGLLHITARGHDPYWDAGGNNGRSAGGSGSVQHLDHARVNFSHVVNELSFGPHYPRLVNPLDNAIAVTPNHFFKYMYYLSLVPTVYSLNRPRAPMHRAEDPLSPLYDPNAGVPTSGGGSGSVVVTNQYAVTQHAHLIGDRQIPGIFFRFQLEPLVLEIGDERESVLTLLLRLVNVLSGVLVAGGWLLQLLDCLPETGGGAAGGSGMAQWRDSGTVRRLAGAEGAWGGRSWGEKGPLGRLVAGEKGGMA